MLPVQLYFMSSLLLHDFRMAEASELSYISHFSVSNMALIIIILKKKVTVKKKNGREGKMEEI